MKRTIGVSASLRRLFAHLGDLTGMGDFSPAIPVRGVGRKGKYEVSSESVGHKFLQRACANVP